MSHGPGRYHFESPNNPQPSPEEEPDHDVPTFPEEDTPPGRETAIRIGRDVRRVAGFKFTSPGPGEHESPSEGDDDVDEDDLDPQVPHSPPDGKKGRIVFDENYVAG